jgi:hypothetical protein
LLASGGRFQILSPVDKAGIAALSERLLDWIDVDKVGDIIGELGERLGDHAMMRIGRPYREGYIAWRFANRRGANALRLLKEQSGGTTPDFEIDLAGQFLRYEATEADVPGRRRQDEYRTPRRAEPMLFTDLDTMVEHMRDLAAKKAAKTYENCRGLIIWVNPPAFSFVPALRWEGLLRGGEPASTAFGEVWALRGNGSLLWLDGLPQPEVRGEEF